MSGGDMRPRCVVCHRFVPVDFIAVHAVGEYGSGPYEDETVCHDHGGPAWGSRAWAQRARELGVDR